MQQATPIATGGPARVPSLTDIVGGLRDSWRTAALSAGDPADLATYLDARLDELEASGRLDRGSLTAVLDEVADRLRARGEMQAVPLVVRRLLRSVYEFLLAVDARAQLAAKGRIPDAADSPDEGEEFDDASDAGGEAPDPSLISPAVHHIEVLLLGGRLAEASELLGLLTDEGMGSWLIPVAIGAGDRCRDAAMAAEARSCYLAAWATDRLDERPLWRLAELALASSDIDLALSYLREVGAIRHWNGDARGVALVYRKMFTLGRALEDTGAATGPEAERDPTGGAQWTP